MEKMLSGRQWSRTARAGGLSALLALALSGSALAQNVRVTGTVISSVGVPLQGVTIRVVERDSIRTQTNASGRYSILAPSEGTLIYTLPGQRPVQQPIGGRTTIDVTMEAIVRLEERVITAYTEQRRADITGAVASVTPEQINRQTTASVLQRLDAVTPGITVNASGSPGSRSTVRIRGISSFQNNDPLYIVDGTPVQDTYVNWLNPNDIASIQVLKDASASSIYGARASNGVVVIETVKGSQTGQPKATFRARTGLAQPVRGYDDFLIQNSADYLEVVRRAYTNAGQPTGFPTNIYGPITSPTIPTYVWPNNCGTGGTTGPCNTVNEANYAYPGTLVMRSSEGTNWWDAVFGTGRIGDYNLDVAGGGRDNQYGVSFNYFDQEGTAAFNRFRRGSMRVNTSFNRGRFNFGENLALAHERSVGGLGNDAGGETGLIGKNILSQPIVPVRDIQGNFAAGKAPSLGNNSNPLKVAYEARNNLNKNNRIFGNVFAGLNATENLSFRSRLGINAGQSVFAGFNPIFPENSEPTFTNSINENQNDFYDWTWSNTARLQQRFFTNHSFDFLVGQEANRNRSRFISGQCSALISTEVDARYVQDALCDASSIRGSSSGGQAALLSYFGKVDYNFADKYVVSFTARRDGSSRLGPSNRWGTFPAFGVGWRLTQEPWMAGNRFLSDAMIRYGWGITGNQSIPGGRVFNQFGGSRADTHYDITGSNSSLQAGFRQTSLGNPNLKWEENKSQNIGADLSLFSNRLDVVLDFYHRETDNLLFNPPIPGTAGVASQPIANVGKMSNRGFDASIGHRGQSWNASLNVGAYRNKIERIDGVQDFFYGPLSTRFGNQVINQLGHPISSFFGYQTLGIFRDAADVAAHATQDGAKPGRLKFKDTNGDGRVTLADRTIIGNPHPDFTAGFDAGARWRSFDINGTIFGSFGNDIWDAQKEFYVFRNFSTNVRRDVLTDSWTPQNPNAKYPQIDVSDVYSYALSSFYIEDGSYVRLRNMQIGYTLPTSMMRWTTGTRVYLQGENLLTFTGYDGLDPALPARDVSGSGGDIRDQYRGIDTGVYPSNRTFSIGFSTSF